MPDTHVLVEQSTPDQVATYDAIVIGAGFPACSCCTACANSA